MIHSSWEHYSGRILHNNTCSKKLKKRVAEYITHFQAFEQIGTPSIPYISAWRHQDLNIWYEFSGKRLQKILGCQAQDVAHAFRDSIVDHYIYKKPANHQTVVKEVLSQAQLVNLRNILRGSAAHNSTTEAVYKLASNGKVFWLKDQAKIEVFPEDGIFLSLGTLVDVSKEMRAEEELKRVKEELKRHRDHLEDLVRDRTRKLWRSQLEVVSRLARAAVYRDQKTGSHITRMSRYCAILGEATGITQKANALLYHASPMHDVGKLGISDRILLKPGKLNSQEFELMKTHCHIGAELLSGHNSDLLKVAQAIAFTHHEKWDGSGYPRGLGAKEIPLAGRIAAICDVFDALTTARPYKNAWPIEHATAELKRQKGQHFDPELVDVFIEKLPVIKEVYLAH
jgi:response regulator RpfG family c-di-GMP phosphodiesterase